MPSIAELYTTKNIKTYWDARKQEETKYVGIDELFGSRKQLEDTIDSVSGKSGYTPALLLNSPDSKTVYRERGEITVEQKKIPFFKEGMQVDEKHIIELMKLEGNPNRALVQMVYDRMFNDSYQLYLSSRMTREIMVNQLLSEGKVSFASNGAAFTATYKITKETDLAGTAKWSDLENSDPLKDIRKMKKDAKINGVARAMCSPTTFDYIVNNAKIKKLLVNPWGGADISDADVLNLIYTRTNVRLYVNDTYYMKDDKSDAQIFPDNIISLFPVGKLGDIVFSVTPEERVLLNKPNVATVSIVDDGVAIVETVDTDAVSIQTKIAMRCLPALDIYPDQIVTLKVA